MEILHMIKMVNIYHSEVNMHDGKDLGPGFAVLVDPHPTDDEDIAQIVKIIETGLLGLEFGGKDNE